MPRTALRVKRKGMLSLLVRATGMSGAPGSASCIQPRSGCQTERRDLGSGSKEVSWRDTLSEDCPSPRREAKPSTRDGEFSRTLAWSCPAKAAASLSKAGLKCGLGRE